MATRAFHVLLRAVLLVAVVASTALWLDYTREAPSFCGGQSGCAAVKASPLSHVFGVPLPTVGLVVFIGLFLAVLGAEKPSQWKIVAAMLTAAGLGGLGLIGYQLFRIHAICPWCVTVDGSAAVAAILGWLIAAREPVEEPWRARFVWLAVGIVAVAAPKSWAGAPLKPVELPAAIRELQTDRIDVILFTDFECPYCRRLHHDVHARLEADPTKFHLVRVMVPLPFHKGSDPAARAFLCAPEPRRDEMADRLYRTDPEKLDKDGMMALAGDLGLDKGAFGQCYEDKATSAKIDADVALYRSLELRGLPTSYVEDKMIVGADSEAFEQAIGGRDLRWMFALLAAAFSAAGAATLVWRAKEKRAAGKPPEVETSQAA